MTTKLTAEIDELLATYILYAKDKGIKILPSKKFPNVFKLLEAIGSKKGFQLCEFENLRCPYCGSTKKPLEMWKQHVTTPTGNRPVHLIHCADCEGMYCIECAD